MSAATAAERVHILCVDDEPNVLGGLTLGLGRRFAVDVAASGAEGLDLLNRRPGIAAVISDMRMPGMDGATFLGRVREEHPDVVRIMLTGLTDLGVAVAAVNRGEVFRFLSKPCAAPTLAATVEAAVKQHQLVTAERVLLQKTLLGSIKAITEVLALSNPAAFSRSMRVKRMVSVLAERLRLAEPWQVEMAAMVSNLACVTLAEATLEKLHGGKSLDDDERRTVSRLPEINDRLLGNIPRLDGVRDIIAMAEQMARDEVSEPTSGFDDQRLMAAHMLRAAIDWDVMEAQGLATDAIVDAMRGRTERYTPEVVAALDGLRAQLAASHGDVHASDVVGSVATNALALGALIVQDLRTTSGQMVAARGQEVNESLLHKLASIDASQLPERILIVHPAKAAAARAAWSVTLN